MERTWHIVADVNQDSGDVVALVNAIKRGRATLEDALEQDVDACTADLVALVASADGLQVSTNRGWVARL